MQGLATNVLRLGNEVRDLSISNAVLRQENEELHKDYEALADEHTKLIDRNKTLKAEVERLKMEESKLLTLCETYEADLERLRKAGDAVALDYAERIEIEAGDTAKNLMKKLPVLREWNATKEGKPSV